jgi:superfamily II DNA or RNA helicase
MRLLIGLEMTQDDHDRILFWNDREKVDEEIRRCVEEELSKEGMPDFERSRLAGLSWMLGNDKLEIKFGVMLDSNTKEPIPWEWGKFHHKICYFEDEQEPENSAMISGSINESEAAWSRNGDSFTALVSWEVGRSRDTVDATKDLFKALWETEGINEDLNVGVFHLADIPDLWKSIVPPIKPRGTTPWPDPGGNGSGDDKEEEWEHKITARQFFLEDRDPSLSSAPMPAGKQGILCMATGTGKTRTALKIVKEMIEDGQIEKVIVTTHKSDLLDQWFEEMANPKRGLVELLPARFRHYGGKYKQMDKFTLGPHKFKSLLVGRTGLQELLKYSSDEELEKTLLIVDECHNFRGEKHRSEMIGKYSRIPYRLGLSATPENEYDDSATQFLFDEIGPIFFNYELLNAIKDGILCPFNYYPEDYTPTNDDKVKAHRLVRQIEAKKKENPRANLDDLYRRISDIYKRSEGKLPVLQNLLKDTTILDRCIIFGPVKDYNSNIKKMLSQSRVRWTPYYGETDKGQLNLYKKGKVDVLLTCKAVSEGMDLDVSNIILLSSNRTKLENIQRIGRALRTHGDLNKVARVIDFIRDNQDDSADTKRKDWLDELSVLGLESRVGD